MSLFENRMTSSSRKDTVNVALTHRLFTVHYSELKLYKVCLKDAPEPFQR
jgi:hypothetical protein